MNMETTQEVPTSDSIERSIHIRAPRARVWQALSVAEEHGKWFGANLAGQVFAPGQRVLGQLTICGHEDVMFDVTVERMEPERLLSYRWHPYAIEPGVDYSAEPRTVVTFTLADADGGTLLTVVESGFDQLPPERRVAAWRMNARGWEAQLKCVERYVVAQ